MGYGLSPDFTQEPTVIFGRANQLTLKNDPSNNAVVFSVDSNGLLTVTTPATGGVTFSGGPLTFTNAVTFSSTVQFNGAATFGSTAQFNGAATFAAAAKMTAARFLFAQGAPVLSASHLTLGTDGNAFAITGTTTINLIDTTGWQAGSLVLLTFTASLTVNSNQAATGSFAAILLAGNGPFSAIAHDTLLLYLDGADSAWKQLSSMVF